MKLPGFRRSRHDQPEPAATPDTAADRASVPDRVGASTFVANRRDWTGLAPMAMTVSSSAPLAANARAFVRDLASRQDFRSTAAMTHLSPASRPMGDVVGRVVVSEPATWSASDASPLPEMLIRTASSSDGSARAAEPWVQPAPPVQPTNVSAVARSSAPTPSSTVMRGEPDSSFLPDTSNDGSDVDSAPLPLPPMPTASDPLLGLEELFAASSTSPTVVESPFAGGFAPRPTPPAPASAQAARTSTEPVVRRNLADSRRLGLGPAYSGALPEAMRLERERAAREAAPGGTTARANTTAPAGSTEPVAADLRAVVRDAIGHDPGEALVHRGPATNAEARRLDAQAFVRDGEIHVSDEVGRLDSNVGRSVVAHELAHLAQQQQATGSIDERSNRGRAMEVQAQAVERYVRGDVSAERPTPDLVHAVPNEHDAAQAVATAQRMMRELVADGFAKDDGNGGITFELPSAPSGSGGVQRLERGATTRPSTSGTGGRGGSSSDNAGREITDFDSLGHNLMQGFAHDMLGIGGSMFGLSDETMSEAREELNADHRQWMHDRAQRQTRETFPERRLEHVRVQRLQTINRELHEQARELQEDLTNEQLDTLRREIEAEADRRDELLQREVAKVLAELNDARQLAGQRRASQIDQAEYDRAFDALFNHPDDDTPPDEPEIDEILRAAVVRARNEAAERSRSATSTGAGGTGTGTGTGTGASPTGSGPSPASSTIRSASAAGAATGARTRTTSPSTEARHETSHPDGTGHRDGATGADHHDTASTSGASSTSSGTTADETPTFGARMRGLGRSLADGFVDDVVGYAASTYGFSETFRDEIDDDIAESRRRRDGEADPATTIGTGSDSAHSSNPNGASRNPVGGRNEAERRTTPTGHEAIDIDHLDLDELAEKLYPNMRSWLRRELLIDRERAGLLADFR